jgi:hypothetical protein
VFLGSATCNKTVNIESPCDDVNYVGSLQLQFCGQMNQMAFEPCFAVRMLSYNFGSIKYYTVPPVEIFDWKAKKIIQNS